MGGQSTGEFAFFNQLDCVVTCFVQVSSTGMSSKKIVETDHSINVIEILDSDDDEVGASYYFICVSITDQLHRKHLSPLNP